MSGAGETCTIPDDILTEYRKFKLSKSKTTNVITFKINPKKLLVEVEDVQDDVDLEDFKEELPEGSPRFMVVSFRWEMEHDRVSFPLVFLFWCPRGINPKLSMMYASTKGRLVAMLEPSKEFDMRAEEPLSEDWLKAKLGK